MDIMSDWREARKAQGMALQQLRDELAAQRDEQHRAAVERLSALMDDQMAEARARAEELVRQSGNDPAMRRIQNELLASLEAALRGNVRRFRDRTA